MKLEMKKQHEKLLVAVLAGMIVVGAAAFAVQPALADNHGRFDTTAPVASACDAPAIAQPIQTYTLCRPAPAAARQS